MIANQTATVNSETEQMEADLQAMRSQKRESEVADLDAGMSFEDWQALYSFENAPGYSERWG